MDCTARDSLGTNLFLVACARSKQTPLFLTLNAETRALSIDLKNIGDCLRSHDILNDMSVDPPPPPYYRLKTPLNGKDQSDLGMQSVLSLVASVQGIMGWVGGGGGGRV